MKNKKTKKLLIDHPRLVPSLLTLALTGGIMAFVTKEVNKMFGESDKIPKGVVREMMEGVVSGLMDYFESEKYDLQRKIEDLESKNNELREKVEELQEKQEKDKKKR